MNLPQLAGLDLNGKRVVVRCDFDFGSNLSAGLARVETVVPTLQSIAQRASKLILLAHRGRPEGTENPTLSLEPLVGYLGDKLAESIIFVPYQYLPMLFDGKLPTTTAKILLVENIRFWKEEESADEQFARKFAELADVYVNEAFSVSHRKHASLVTLPLVMKSQGKPVAVGLRFEQEIANLSKVASGGGKPVVFIFGGVKEDKLAVVGEIAQRSDKVLIGGRLPEYIHDTSPLRENPKIMVANLTPDKEDITINSIEAFEKEIATAGTIVLAGPLGKYEDEAHANGTKRVLQAVANSEAFKIAAGGDTAEALASFGFEGSFDWTAIGGGATLEFLAKGTLPGIEAVVGQLPV